MNRTKRGTIRKNSIRTYYNRKLKSKHKTERDLLLDLLKKQERFEQIEGLYLSVGIPKEYHKAMNSLYYRFKYNNVYYNKLVNIYLQDYTKQDFFNMCYMVALEHTPEDFRLMWCELREQLETETAVNRRQKQKQAYKVLSLDEMVENNIYTLSDCSSIDGLLEHIDLEIIYEYIKNNLTPKQVETLRNYLSTNKKMDSRAKKRIIAKLKTTDFKKLLY